jgi:hypothetical protein
MYVFNYMAYPALHFTTYIPDSQSLFGLVGPKAGKETSVKVYVGHLGREKFSFG